MRQAAPTYAVAAAALVVVAACHPPAGSASGSGDQSGVSQQQLGTVSVHVVNHNPLDVTIYLLHSGVRDRLGSVTAASDASFVVTLRSLGAGHEYQLLAMAIGSPRSTQTSVMHAQDGDAVTWTLETDLDRSSVEIH